MSDPRFFIRSGAKTLAQVAQAAGAELDNGADPDLQIDDVAPLESAGPRQLSFLDNRKYREAFSKTKAAACVISPEMKPFAPSGVALLLSRNPYKAYALAAQVFYPEIRPAPSVHPSVIVDPSAKIGNGCTIEAGVVIAAGVEIGENTWIEANAVIGPGVRLGRDCRVGANANLAYSLIGDHVRIYPGCRIGQDGFGFAIDPAGHVKVPQLGRVIIEDSVEVGANTCIDRGSGPDTVIGQGTWIDNLVQIAHNVKIGKGCVIVAQVGISGSTVLEDYVVLAGQSGVAGHLRIGKGARIAGGAGVIRDVPAGEEQMGYPSVPFRQFMRQAAILAKLAKREKV